MNVKHDMFNCFGTLDLSYLDVTELPDNLTVPRDLYLSHTPIAILPESLTVGRNLFLHGTNVNVLPATLKVGGRIFGFHELPFALDIESPPPQRNGRAGNTAKANLMQRTLFVLAPR